MTGQTMPDSGGQPGATGDVRLTYQELGERLRISAEAARILTRRRGWRRLAPSRKGAPAIVVVLEDELDAEDWRPDQGSPPDEERTRQQNLRPFKLARRVVAPAQHRRELRAFPLVQLHPVPYVHHWSPAIEGNDESHGR